MAATTAQRSDPISPRSSHAASQDLGGGVDYDDSQLPLLGTSSFSSGRYGPAAAAKEERKDSNDKEVRRTSAHTFGNPCAGEYSLLGSPTGSIIDHDADAGVDLDSAVGAADGEIEDKDEPKPNLEAPPLPSGAAHNLDSSAVPPSSGSLPSPQRPSQSASFLQQQPPRDDSAYGIPSRVMVDGQWIDIRDLDILDQVEMIRQAKKAATLQQEQERKMQSQQQQQQGGDGGDSGEREKRSTREVLEAMNYTELSDIA
jgi:hypothetical protein